MCEPRRLPPIVLDTSPTACGRQDRFRIDGAIAFDYLVRSATTSAGDKQSTSSQPMNEIARFNPMKLRL